MRILNLISLLGLLVFIGIKEIQEYVSKNKKQEKKSNLDDFFNQHDKKIWIIFAIVFFISIVYKFGELPTYLGVDEAGGAYDAMNIARYGVDRYLNSFPVYLINFGGGQSVLYCYLTAICIKLFGANIISYRLPMLVVYFIAMISSYLFVSKCKDKKTALLFTFCILTCPWNVVNTRQALDCNLYAGMFMLDLFLMNIARKNYQYILAGISVGITLYTYSLSWISLPIFLLVWCIYMLYLKKLTWKHLVLFALPITLLAAPLIYFLLVNYNIVPETQIGIFTIPKLYEFRANEIAISNIWNYGLDSLKTIFLCQNTVYPLYLFLFLIGYFFSVIQAIKSIRKKEYHINAVMVIAFSTILLGSLLSHITTPNKANVLYFPILYFVSIAILKLFEKTKILFILTIFIICILFIHFEYQYYTNDAYHISSIVYEDNSFYEVTKKLEENEQTKNKQKHVITIKSCLYIYQLLVNEISPYEYQNSFTQEIYGPSIFITQVQNYHYYHYRIHRTKFLQEALQEKDAIFIISDVLTTLLEDKNFKNYSSIKYKDLMVLIPKNSGIDLETILNPS